MNTALKAAPYHTSEEDIPYFEIADYFAGVAQRVAQAQIDARITLPGHGSVTMLPAQGKYYADVADMAAFCRAPAKSFQVSNLDSIAPEQFTLAHPLRDLFWQAGFYASEGRLISQRANKESVHIYDVVQMQRWPNLTRLPMTPNTMQICALITRHPSSIMLIHRKLGIEAAEVYQVYSAACCARMIKVFSSNLAENGANNQENDLPAARSGLLRKLFSRLAEL